ncbi:MAG: AbrB/MazE/SpoVT family DNA-binding domain-containing protein [Candidatus Levybacteria bacterium]|nr:AbrB/MazE/SpoVT family DNA-binding domain-containing protein [Candidatus Levybacteria bacterium]
MKQKVITVGNSLAVTLPQAFVKEGKVKPGQIIDVETSAKLGLVQIRTKTNGTHSGLTPEFFEWLEKFNAKYKNALTELAKK